MRKLFTSKMCENAKIPTKEVLDNTPIAVIAPSQRRPETLSQAINRIMEGTLSEEQWERLRGVEYDGEGDFYEDDKEEEWEDFEKGSKEHDDQGFFAPINGRSAQPDYEPRDKDTMEDSKNAPQIEDNNNKKGGDK